MNQFQYRFNFSDIDVKKQSVRVTCVSPGYKRRILKNNNSKNLTVSIDDSQLTFRVRSQMKPELADLLDIATAVYVADWLSPREVDANCEIHLSIPVRNLELFNKPLIIEELQKLLFVYTHTHWFLDFKKRNIEFGRLPERQSCTGFEEASSLEVALWSGGLDSLAGLITRLTSSPTTDFILIGAGSNTIMQGVQKKLQRQVKEAFPTRTNLIQLPIHLKDSKGLAKNSLQRSRGFVFATLGAVTAYLQKQQHLYIYENGIGAINLPFRASEVGLDHTKSVHPVVLSQLSQFLSNIFGEPFEVRNPFIFLTKGEMCMSLKNVEYQKFVKDSISCDGLHREKVMACGYCSSCLLRRQALLAANIDDETEYLVINESIANKERIFDSNYLYCMREQINILNKIFSSVEVQKNFMIRFPEIFEIVSRTAQLHQLSNQEMIEKILDLYKRYVIEWNAVEDILGRELLQLV